MNRSLVVTPTRPLPTDNELQALCFGDEFSNVDAVPLGELVFGTTPLGDRLRDRVLIRRIDVRLPKNGTAHPRMNGKIVRQ